MKKAILTKPKTTAGERDNPNDVYHVNPYNITYMERTGHVTDIHFNAGSHLLVVETPEEIWEQVNG